MKYLGTITQLEKIYYGGANKVVKKRFGDIGAFLGERNCDTKEDHIWNDDRTTNPYNLLLGIALIKKLEKGHY